MRRIVAAAWMSAAACTLAACQSPNQFAKEFGQPPRPTLELRSLQTRRFDAADEKAMLAACTDTLQDLGFTLTESVADAGLLVGSKQRDAHEAGQVAGQVVLTVLSALGGQYHHYVVDRDQTIEVAVVTTPVGNSRKVDVRVEFDRIVVNTDEMVSQKELLLDQKYYDEFFERLSKSLFLEGQKV